MSSGGLAGQLGSHGGAGSVAVGSSSTSLHASSNVAGGASNNHAHHSLSSGGPNIHLMNMVESGDADDGGRDGDTRYFTDVTQDEGTGGESYTQ